MEELSGTLTRFGLFVLQGGAKSGRKLIKVDSERQLSKDKSESVGG